MKILFINPPYDSEKYYGKLKQLRFLFPPVGLLYVAGYIREKGYKVKLYDFETSEDDFDKSLLEFGPDIIGITCQTALVKTTIALCRRIKSIYPRTKIVVGGYHPSSRPMDLLDTGNVEYAVRGEGEETFYDLVKTIEQDGDVSQVKGIYYLDESGQLVANPMRPLIKDLNSLPMMAIDLLPIEKYHTSPDLLLGKRTALISTSRGCPNKCIFCAVKDGFRHGIYRTRSIDNIFSEINYYIERYDIDSLFIMDDTFTLSKKKVEQFCNRMVALGYHKKIKWWAQTRVDTVDQEILNKMKEAGCEIISYGLESGVQRLLDTIKKRTKIEKTKEVIAMSKKSGLNVRGSFILGLPTETVTDSLKTIYFALSLPLDRVKFGVATPYPGTELWDYAVKEGQIHEHEDWDRFTQMAGFTKFSPPYLPKNRNATELKLLHVAANTIFYLKPRIFWGMFQHYAKHNLLGKFIKSAIYYLRATISH